MITTINLVNIHYHIELQFFLIEKYFKDSSRVYL